MDIKSVINRLKSNGNVAKLNIIREIRELPFEQRRDILDKLHYEKTRSDNSDVIDEIDDILDELSPKR